MDSYPDPACFHPDQYRDLDPDSIDRAKNIEFENLSTKVTGHQSQVLFITFEWLDRISNLKRLKCSEFCQEFNTNIICNLDSDPDQNKPDLYPCRKYVYKNTGNLI